MCLGHRNTSSLVGSSNLAVGSGLLAKGRSSSSGSVTGRSGGLLVVASSVVDIELVGHLLDLGVGES